jgi:hypothetical protein
VTSLPSSVNYRNSLCAACSKPAVGCVTSGISQSGFLATKAATTGNVLRQRTIRLAGSEFYPPVVAQRLL